MGDARETEKAPDAFRTISEVAEDLELPQHVLRFWESRFTQIKPVKRAGGRRFYRPEDVDLLRGIRHLLYTDGYTIKGAQRILKEQGVRFVQDFGVEREVAVMRSARPARAPAGEGVTFGGLLGLLPRRRPRAGGGGPDDDALPELPSMAELPLPFPDREADRDLEAEGPVPPIALRQTPSALRQTPSALRQAPPALHQAPPALRQPPPARPRREPPDERRRDPTFDALPPDPRGHREPGLEDEHPAMRRAGPRAPAAGPRRIEPELMLQRPTRGPAARAAATARPALAPEMDDPLLPFLDDERAMPAGVSEPIEDRIRRLKAQERRPEREPPFAGEVHHEPGPPEEYIPARARRDAAGPSVPHVGAPAPTTAQARWEVEAPRAPAPRDRAEIPREHVPRADVRRANVPRDGEWRQTDWVEASWGRVATAEDGDDAQAFHDTAHHDTAFPNDAFPNDAFHDTAAPERAPHHEPPFHDARYHDPISREPASHRRPHREVPRQMAEDAYSETRMVEQDRHRPPAAPVHAERRDPLTAAPAASPRGGPTWPDADMRRAWGDSAPQALPRATRVGPLIAPIDEEETIPAILRRPDPEPVPEPPALRRTAPWGQGEAGAEPAGPPRGPREPLRHGPPEQYLPPHLRSEPRVVGQAPMAAPVMSRDDVHRLQSALYELGECRRLMEGVLGGDGGEPRDAG